MTNNSGGKQQQHRQHRRSGRVKKLLTAVGKRQRPHHVTGSTTAPAAAGPVPHWEESYPPRSHTQLPTTTTTIPTSGKETGGSLHAVHGAMIGCALALILMLTPMLALFGRKALARRRMRQFQSKRGNVAGCNDPNNKLYVPQDIVRRHQVVARVESRDVGTTPELIIPTNVVSTHQQQQQPPGFTLIENLAYGDFIGCTADPTPHPGISLSPPFDGEAATAKKSSAVDVVYVNLGSNIPRNKRRREHAYEMIDSTSAGLQIRATDNLHPPPPSEHALVGKRHSRDKVTTFPFHPGCSESSDSARLEFGGGGDHRTIYGPGYDRRLSGRPPGGAKKHHLPLWSGNGAGGSIRYKQEITGSIASSFTRGKEETTTTMEQLMRDRGGTRVRRKRRLKRRTHDLRRKRAHIRRLAAIKRHQIGGVGVVVGGGGKREATILEVDDVAPEQRRISTSSLVSNYSAYGGCLAATEHLPAVTMDNGGGMLSSSSRHSTMDRGYGTCVSLGKFRLPSISEHERRNSVNNAAKTPQQQHRRFTVHGALPSSSVTRPKNITTTTTNYDVISTATTRKSRSSGNVAQLKTFTRKSTAAAADARKPVLKSKSVPHLNRISAAPPPPGNYLKESASVLDVLGCYMKSKNYNTDYSRSVLRIRDAKLYPVAVVASKQLTEADSTCSGGSVVSCPLLGQSVVAVVKKQPLLASSVSKPSPLSRQRPRSAMLSGTASKTRIPSKRKRKKSRSLHDVFMPLDPSTENLSVFMEMSI